MVLVRLRVKVFGRDFAEEVDLHDTILTSLVEILEEKGVVTQKEWEKSILIDNNFI